MQAQLQPLLPQFTRTCWASEEIKSTWAPRIARIQQAWATVEWRSVVAGIRKCGLLWLSPDELSAMIPLWRQAGLSAVGLGERETAGDSAWSRLQSAGMSCVVVGNLDDVETFRSAWSTVDNSQIGALLGYPTCCRSFFHEVWTERQLRDTTWSMAARTVPSIPDGALRIDLGERGPSLANILWRWVGVRAAPHLPCRFDCEASTELGERLLQVAADAGFAEEADWIREILAWPVEWSALHGIAEVKSPVMKLTTHTDQAPGKRVIHWVGTRFPQGGAIGLHFPHQTPRKGRAISPAVARSPSSPSRDLSWQFRDNGFSTREAMDNLHLPIASLAREMLANEQTGNVLDLGCGNGTLLSKICADGKFVPYGVDANSLAVEHAEQVLLGLRAHLVVANLFDVARWRPPGRRYALALLMIGRLTEVAHADALTLLDALRSSCDRVMVYAYPDWGGDSLSAIAQRFDLSLRHAGDGSTALLN